MEQFPLSNEKSIAVEDRTTIPQAITNDKTGAIRWTMQLQPNEMQQVHMNYSVKYSKDKPIYNL